MAQRSRIFELTEDGEEVLSFARIVTHELCHLHRLVTLLSPQQRSRVIEASFRSEHDATSNVSLHDWIRQQWRMQHDLDVLQEKVERVRVPITSTRIVDVATGTWDFGVARTLHIAAGSDVRPGHVLTAAGTLIQSALARDVLTIDQAGALLSCITYSRDDFERARNSAESVVEDARTVGSLRHGSNGRINKLLGVLNYVGDFIADEHDIWRGPFLALNSVVDNFPALRALRETAEYATIYVPQRQGIVVASTMADVAREVERDRTALYKLDPRAFERFMADLFRHLGYEVELTKQTRDGGADLVCVRRTSGIPFRVAFELKRYAEDRPISVQLVRAFVGANEQFRANKMVFVTTSRYTHSAREYAEKWAAPLLELRDYQAIVEWCREVRKQPLLM